MNALGLALAASLAWSFADFAGPLKGRTYGVLTVLLLGQVAGLATIGIVVAASGRGPHGAGILWALPAAFCGTLGLAAFYRGMQVGAMSVVAPIAGLAAAIPVLFGVARGERPSLLEGAGMGLALVGVVLASVEPRTEAARERRVAAGVGLALLAALGWGFYFPPMHAAGEADVIWSVLLFRLVSVSGLVAVALVKRPRLRVPPLDLSVVAAAGILDMAGNFLYAGAAAEHGLVSVVSVLASLYPVGTILLARALLGERISRLQDAGVVLTLAGIGLIAAG